MPTYSDVYVNQPEEFPYPLAHDGTKQQEFVNKVLVKEGPYFVHPEGSPYLGLTVDEQKTLSLIRRSRIPGYKSKEGMRKAVKKDYERLLLHCTEVMVKAWHSTDNRLDRIPVYIKLPYDWRSKYDKSLPRAFIIGHDDYTVTISWYVDKVVDWLYNKGYSVYNSVELRKSIWAILKEQEKLDFYYEVAAETSIIELYSDIIDDAYSEFGKRKKRDGVIKGRHHYKKKMKESVDTKE